MLETENTNELIKPSLQVGYGIRKAIGYSVNGDDMHWIVACPQCEKKFEYEGYFDSGEETKCKCGCTFLTSKVWIDDTHYIR